MKMSFTIASETKILGINIMKDVQKLYENYETILEKKWKNTEINGEIQHIHDTKTQNYKNFKCSKILCTKSTQQHSKL